MQAIILGAGFGTRLQPVTDTIAKAVLPVLGRPLLVYTVEYLKKQGVKQAAMNVHHLAGQVNECIKQELKGRPRITVNFEKDIRGTGGGVKGLEPYVGAEDFIVYNGDIITDLSLKAAFDHHRAHGALATLVLHDRPGLNMVFTGDDNRVVDIRNLAGKGGTAARTQAFTGISILNRRIFSLLPPDGYADIVQLYVHLLQEEKELIGGYTVTGHYWRDIGSVKSYWELHRDVLKERKNILAGAPVLEEAAFLDQGSEVSPGVQTGGFLSVGKNATVRAGTVTDCVILPDTVINEPADYTGAVIGPGYVLTVQG